MSVCRFCGKETAFRFRSYNIRVCAGCYPDFYEKLVRKTLERYKMVKKGEKIALAVSGGKDSMAMAEVMRSLSNKLGFEIITLHINLNISEYSKKSVEIVKEFDPDAIIISVKDVAGFSVDELTGKTCSACGKVKRYLMNKVARELGADKLATGHTADDISVFFIKNWLSGNFQWSDKLLPVTPSFHPLILTRIRPLYERTEKESTYYVLTKEVDFVIDECPHSPGDEWKDILYEVERKKPGFKQNFVRGIVRFSRRRKEEWNVELCPECGEVSSGGLCSFCRLRRRVTKE